MFSEDQRFSPTPSKSPGGQQDSLSYKERFRNNFNKFTPGDDDSQPSARCKNSDHLGFLFDKAQGIGAGQSAGDRDPTRNRRNDNFGKISADHQNGGEQQQQQQQPDAYNSSRERGWNRPTAHQVSATDEGGSISERAVPATPDFLKANNPLSSMTIDDSPKFHRQTSRMSDAGQQPTNGSTTSADVSPPWSRGASGRAPRAASESAGEGSETSGRVRPSFEQTRRHWVYTPNMSKLQQQEDNQPVERKKHPGARSRPLPEYLNFRKYSVPLVSPRPKVEVKQTAVDDQSPRHEMMRPLQKSSADVDCSSVHQLLREGDELSRYDEQSIRYTGSANPSRVFQLLQCATGSDGETLAEKPPMRRRAKKPQQEESQQQQQQQQQQDADDIVDITYIGANIPSRTFQCLREAFDDKDSRDPFSSTELLEPTSEPIRSVKVIHLRPRKSIDDGITSF